MGDEDAPAPVTQDQSKGAESGRKSSDPWKPAANDAKVDAFGTFSDTVAIEVPAFHGIEPKLALDYASSSANGWLGVGWQLDGAPRIVRAGAGRGTPRYDSSDVFLFEGEELVPCVAGSVSPSCTSGGTHSKKTEDYTRIALSGAGSASRWTVTEKSGRKSVYAPVFTLTGDLIAKWGLQQVSDTKNNVVSYTWAANGFNGRWDYLDSISYGGTLVKFNYEQRTDLDTNGVGAGTYEITSGRLKTIDVSVSGGRVRAYRLQYASSSATNRSLLTSVQQFGKDAVLDATGTITGGTSFPAINVGYSSPGAPTFASTIKDDALGNGSDQRFITLDVNGDGKSDMLEIWKTCFIGCTYSSVPWLSNGTTFIRSTEFTIPSYDETSEFLAMDVDGDGDDDLVSLTQSSSKWKRSVFLSNGTTFAAGTTDTAMSFEYHTTDNVKYIESHFLTGDVNGDGKTDLIEIVPYACFLCTTKFNRVAWLSNGNGFTQASNETGIVYDQNSQFFALDFNGDGKTDFVELEPGAFGALNRRVWISNGAAFTQAVSDASDYSQSLKVLVMDVNGDGKSDLVEFTPDFGGTRRKTFLSTGSSLVLSSSVWSSMSIGTTTRIFAADVNGDGRSDFFAVTPVPFAAKRTIYLSTGADFVESTVDNLPSATNHRYLPADVDGDGRTDMIELYDVFGGYTRRLPWIVGGAFPDLLTSLGTGLGGTTTVTYGSSSEWPNTNNPPLVQTAKTVTVADGRGGASTTTYSYAGGKYDAAEQRFLGFASQKAIAPCITGETACPYTVTTFLQNNALGKPGRIDAYDGAGRMLRAHVDVFTTNTTVPRTALPTASWDYVYANSGAACPGADCKRTCTTRTFNAYGEVTQAVDYGDYDVAGDEVTTTTVFAPNVASFIADRPADVKTFQGIGIGGALLQETTTNYDGAADPNVPPTAGFPTKKARWLSTSAGFVVTKKEYDAWGNVTAIVDPLDGRTTFTFDGTYHRFVTKVTNALNQATTAGWDVACGSPTQTTNRNGQTTTLTYDPLCRLVQKTEPGGKFEKHVWSALGDAASQYEEVQRPSADGTTQAWWSRRYFDGLDRTWREAKKGPDAATGNVYADTSYNARGERASTTAPYYWATGTPTTAPTTFGYDALDRPTRVTFPDGAQQTTFYGLWSVTTTDELGRSKTDRFDANGNRIAHVETVSGVAKTTSYAYDARQSLRQSVDPAGNLVTYTTDSLGHRTSMVDPSSGTSTYEFDGAGQLIAQLDPKNQKTTFGYDALHRRTSKTSRANATPTTVSWAYDQSRTGFFNIGFLTTVTDGSGTKVLDYDVAGRVVKSARTIDGTNYVFAYGFDAGDRPLWTTFPDGDTLGTSAAPLLYDSAGRLKTIPGYVTTARYDAADAVTQYTNTNGTVTTRVYSPARGWLTGVNTTLGGTTIQNLVYTRNAKGLVSQVSSPVGNEGWTFGYDDLDRVTSATNASSSTHNQTLSYDPIGNILSNSRVGTYSYGARPHAVTAAGGLPYTYDAAGLLISGGGRTLTWNGDNRLASVTTGGTTWSHTYDADGARIKQTNGASTRIYLGDDYEVDGTVTKYVSLGGILVARKDGATKTWLHVDQLGSIQAETAASGAEIHRRKYRAYGEILSDSASLDFEPRGFTGERQDPSGLVYLHARYYDPQLGRFISPDLIVDGSDTVGLNRNAYVGNNPVNATDPSGLGAVVTTKPKTVDAKEKENDPPPPPPPPPPPSYPRSEGFVESASPVAPLARGSSNAAKVAASVGFKAARSSVVPRGNGTVGAKGASPRRVDSFTDKRRSKKSRSNAETRKSRPNDGHVQALNGPGGPFPTAPLEDEEDWVVEIWANLMRDQYVGPEEWDRIVGDGS